MSVRNQILILLACSLLVVNFGNDWGDAANQVAASVRSATLKAKDAERLVKTVQSRLEIKGGEIAALPAPPLLESRISDTAANLHRLAKNNLIDLNQMMPEGVASGSTSRPVSNLIQTNAAGLPFIRLQIKGQYKTLKGLQRLTEGVSTGYVGISRLKLDRDAFELDLEIYGEV